MKSFSPAGIVKRLISPETIFAILLGSLSSAGALPVLSCSDLFEKPFWTRETAEIPHAGLKHLVAFSYDADITLGTAYELALRPPSPGAEAPAAPSALREAFDAITGPITQKRLRFAIESSQVELALREGIDPSSPTFRLTDLKPEAMSLVFSRADGSGFSDASPALKTYVVPALRRAGLGAEIVVRARRLSVRHVSATVSPTKFAGEIKLLKILVKPSHIDFHLGLPSDATSETKALSIARVLEARMTLMTLAADQAMPLAKESDPFAHDLAASSSFSPTASHGVRGPVEVDFDQFLSPYNAHDLEMKSTTRSEVGLDLLELGSRLAATPVIVPAPTLPLAFDAVHGALGVSLELYATLLHDESLLKLAREANSRNVSPETIARVRNYLRRHQVIARGTAALLNQP